MSDLKGHNVMNVNRSFILFFLSLCLFPLFLFKHASAQNFSSIATAPALANVKEIVVMNARSGGSNNIGKCNVNSEKITADFVKSLKKSGLPAFSLVEAKPARIDIARIELQPEIVTFRSDSGECSSWVSVSAQTQNVLKIPPIEAPRSVIVTYWRGGLLVNSGEMIHKTVVGEALEKLGRQFSAQYHRDQPPTPPSFEEKEEEEYDGKSSSPTAK